MQLQSPPVPYWRDVIRAAGISPEMRSFRLRQFGDWLAKHGLLGRKVLEVGCGQGEYLSLLAQAGAQAYGIEHRAESIATCRQHGLQVDQLSLEQPDQLVPHGPFDGFIMLSFLEHLPEPHLALQAIAANLKEGGIGLLEVPNFDMIIEQALFAEFIPDHLYYFTKQTFRSLIESNGFELLDCRPVWHDYILSATIRKRQALDLSRLKEAQEQLEISFTRFIDSFPPGRVAIWGAGHQALALISLMKLSSRIACVIDSAPFKQGRYTPASHLPILPPEHLSSAELDAVIVLTASYTDEVLRQIRARHGMRFTLAYLKNGTLLTLA